MTTKLLALSLITICLFTACGGGSNSSAGKSSSKSTISSSTSPSSINSIKSSNSSTVSTSIPSSSNALSSSSAPSKPIALSYGSNVMQLGELRLPTMTTDERVPLVIIIHGGCWVSSYANYHFMDNFSKGITSLGYATWNIEYRALGTGGDWPTIFQDVSKAVDYSRTIAQNYPVDINKVAVIGHSAGGHLALWTASRKNLTTNSIIYVENPLPIKGVISLAGIANVTGYNTCGALAKDIIGVPLSPSSSTLTQRLRETSPLQMLPIKTRTILMSGSSDGIVPPPMGTEYSTEAVNQGDASTHYILQGLDHFDLIDPNNTSWSLYQESLTEIFKD